MGAEQGRWVPACQEDGGADHTCSSSSLSCIATSRIRLMSLRAFLNLRCVKLTRVPLTYARIPPPASAVASPAAGGGPAVQSPAAVDAMLP